MRKPRVMIYEDDLITLNMLKRFFARRGYEIYSSSEPVECPLYGTTSGRCEKVNLCSDIAIAEYKMPGMTGLELFQQQSERGCKLDIKMKAVMSAYPDEKLLRVCNDLGCKFFEKPLEMAELSAWLAECEKHYDLLQPLNDKRSDTRHVFNQIVEYYIPEVSHEKFIGITLDKGTDGFGLRIFHPLRTGEKITIFNRFEKTKKPGIVLWCRKQGKTIYRAGLRLLNK